MSHTLLRCHTSTYPVGPLWIFILWHITVLLFSLFSDLVALFLGLKMLLVCVCRMWEKQSEIKKLFCPTGLPLIHQAAYCQWQHKLLRLKAQHLLSRTEISWAWDAASVDTKHPCITGFLVFTQLEEKWAFSISCLCYGHCYSYLHLKHGKSLLCVRCRVGQWKGCIPNKLNLHS